MQEVTLTQNAADKLSELLMETYQTPNLDDKYFRVYIQGGGCSGFEYGFDFTDEKNDDDFEFNQHNIHVLIDSISMQYLQNSNIDYKEELMGSRFIVNNPNAKSTCSCGASFNYD